MDIIRNKQIPNYVSKHNFTTLVCSSSFEERCFSVVNFLDSRTKFKETAIFRVTDLNPRILTNSELYYSKVNSENYSVIDFKMNDIISSIFAVREYLKKLFLGYSKKVLVDVTTFTHEGLLILLRYISDYKRKSDEIQFIYNAAKNYSCRDTNDQEKWLTKGIKEVRNVIGYPGSTDILKDNHLIVLFGFEEERTRRIIEHYDFQYFSLAHGSKEGSISNHHQIINQERHQNFMDRILDKVGYKFEISLTNPELAKQQILNYVSKIEKQNIVVAPMNNKISTIGAGLAAIENKEIQLAYLQPTSYNFDGYSEMSDVYYSWKMRSG